MVEINGIEAVLKTSSKAMEKDAINIAEGLKKCADIVLKKSQLWVPVETGALRSSGKVVVEGQGFGTRAYVVYGGPSQPREAYYAPYVHENTSAYHKPPTTSKFLEKAVRATRGTCTSVLRRQFQAGIQTTRVT